MFSILKEPYARLWYCNHFQITVERCSMSHEPSEIILICWFAKNKQKKQKKT